MIFPPTHQFCEIRSQNQWKNHVFQFEFYHQICSPRVWPVPVCSAGAGRFSAVTDCGPELPLCRDISRGPSGLDQSVWTRGALTSWPGERGRWGTSPSDCGWTWNINTLLRTELKGLGGYRWFSGSVRVDSPLSTRSAIRVLGRCPLCPLCPLCELWPPCPTCPLALLALRSLAGLWLESSLSLVAPAGLRLELRSWVLLLIIGVGKPSTAPWLAEWPEYSGLARGYRRPDAGVDSMDRLAGSEFFTLSPFRPMKLKDRERDPSWPGWAGWAYGDWRGDWRTLKFSPSRLRCLESWGSLVASW